MVSWIYTGKKFLKNSRIFSTLRIWDKLNKFSMIFIPMFYWKWLKTFRILQIFCFGKIREIKQFFSTLFPYSPNCDKFIAQFGNYIFYKSFRILLISLFSWKITPSWNLSLVVLISPLRRCLERKKV